MLPPGTIHHQQTRARWACSAVALALALCGGCVNQSPPGNGDAGATADAGAPPATDAGPISGSCGTCPTGYHCGSANSIAVCRKDGTNIPLLSHVFVVVMENTSYSTLTSSTYASVTPYIHSLMADGAYSTDYHGVAHPSLPNYVAMTSGDTFGIACDCSPAGQAICSGGLDCTLGCSCPVQATNLADQLEQAGLGWRDYAEDMGTPCDTTASGNYAPRHVPFLYYDDVRTDAARCAAHVVDYAQLAADEQAGGVPDFVYITPNLAHDMHDPTLGNDTVRIQNGDTWLSTEIPKLQARSEFQQGGLIVIVWDEDDLSGVLAADDPIPMFLLSPYAKTGYASNVHADHYSLLATIEDGLDMPRLGNAAGSTPLSDFFSDK